MLIYILDASGIPLMPTTRVGHIRRLLNRGKARIATKVPFTVQLKYETAGITQPLHGGTDPGRQILFIILYKILMKILKKLARKKRLVFEDIKDEFNYVSSFTR